MKKVIAVIACIGLAAAVILSQRVIRKDDEKNRLRDLTLLWYEAKINYGENLPTQWDDLFYQSVGDVVRAGSGYEHELALNKLLAAIGDGHAYAIVPYYRSDFYSNPIIIGYFDDKFVVIGKMKGTKSPDIPIGSMVEAIDGMETGLYLEQQYGMYVGLHTENAREAQLARQFRMRDRGDTFVCSILKPGAKDAEQVAVTFIKSQTDYEASSRG